MFSFVFLIGPLLLALAKPLSSTAEDEEPDIKAAGLFWSLQKVRNSYQMVMSAVQGYSAKETKC